MHVYHETIRVLNAHGHTAYALSNRPDYLYPFHGEGPPRLYDRALAKRRLPGRLRLLRSFQRDYAPLPRAFRGPACPRWRPAEGDIVIVPDYAADLGARPFPPGIPAVLFVQGGEILWRTSARPGFDPGRFSGFIAVSEACAAACQAVCGRPAGRIPPVISGTDYAFRAEKKPQIAYMPRRRGDEVAALIPALRRAPALQGMDFVPIDGVSSRKAAEIMGESLFFLSFSQREGFGLPPAEAMATGAIVIGYRGVGGAEYFTEETGFPVPEDETTRFYNTVIDVVSRWRATPTAFEAKRRRASDLIHQRYSGKKFEQSVLKMFGEMRN